MAMRRPALRDPCAVRVGKERRIGYELIQAYERGEDRRELFREALLNGAFCDAERDLDRSYVGLDVRLQQDRYGEDLEIPAHLGEPIKTRTLAQSLCDTDNETCLVLLVFDDELCVLRARNIGWAIFPRGATDAIFCRRTTALEDFAQEIYTMAATRPVNAVEVGPDNYVLEGDYRTCSCDPPLLPTSHSLIRDPPPPTQHGIQPYYAQLVSAYIDAIEDLCEGRLLVAWSGLIQTESYDDRMMFEQELATLHSFPNVPAARHIFTAITVHAHCYMWDTDDDTFDLPPPGTLRRIRNWDVRGPHVVRRALFDKRRATTGKRKRRATTTGKRRAPLSKDAAFGKFLYETSPTPMFRLILSFL